MNAKLLFLISALALLFLSGCVSSKYESRDTSSIAPSTIASFQTIPNATICVEDGKPIIRLYATTICPHCRWINATFNGVIDEYKAKGLIAAYHWDLDIGNDQFTPGKESSVPKSEVELFTSTNPQQSVPTYLFGCKYWRVGNAYETQDDLDAEAAEFKAVIEKLLGEVGASG
ncbi:MAG: hypothetical protein AABW68_03565 [archaeon]